MFSVRKSEDPRYIAIASSMTMCDCSLKSYQNVNEQMIALYPDGIKGNILYDMLCSLGPNHTRFYEQRYNSTSKGKSGNPVTCGAKPVTLRKVGDQILENQLRFYAQDFSTLKSRSILTQDYINNMIEDFKKLTK